MADTEATSYAFTTKIDAPYEQVRERVAAALKVEGFGVLTEIDVKQTMKQKIDAEFRKYAILGACNPNLAYKALSTDLEIGLLLPCNVIVYEEDGGSVVSIVDPRMMMQIAANPELESVAQEARARLQRVIESLSA